MARVKEWQYHVAPRYTAGSPAMVTADTAIKVAREEVSAYLDVLAGRKGDEAFALAFHLGRAGIVEMRRETRKGWDVVDLCTHARFIRPYPAMRASSERLEGFSS